MAIYNKTAFKKHQLSGRFIGNKGMVDFFNKPTGAICTVEVVAGMPNLRNGESRMINDTLSRELVARGITGDVIVHHRKLSRNVSKWIGHALHKQQPSDYMGDIVIYTFGDCTTAVGEYPQLEIRPLVKETAKEQDVASIVRAGSVDDDYDGILIVGCRGDGKPGAGNDWYHILPVRTASGKIVGFATATNTSNLAGLIVDVEYQGSQYQTVIRVIPKWLTSSDYYRHRNELIGKTAMIEFTSFTAGDRLKNFSSVVVTSVS